jgi:hypothetical protein
VCASAPRAEQTAGTLARGHLHGARIALDMIEEYAPQAKMSPPGSSDLGVPEVK